MTRSDFGGLRLESSVKIDELPIASRDRPPDLRLVGRATAAPSPTSWSHQWTNDGDVVLSMGRMHGLHVFEFEDGTIFEFDRGTRTVICAPLDASARHQLLDHVLPRVLDDLGHLMIHGSAVDAPDGAIVFVGDSGIGKSTLAASFQSVGVDLLSDDCLRLAQGPDANVWCTPTYRSLRLWPDSVSTLMATSASEPMSEDQDKRRVRLTETATTAPCTTVAAICVLAAPRPGLRGIQLNHVAPSRSMSLLLAQCFRLDPTDVDATKRAFERIADVVECVPVVELIYDRSYDRLPEVREAVLRLSAEGDPVPITSRRRPTDPS